MKPKRAKQRQYWVTNISPDRDVSLGDLRVTIRSMKSVNLLDKKHYSYTYEQLEQSRLYGSIKAKSNIIKVRDSPPKTIFQPGIKVAKNARIAQIRNAAVQVEKKKFEELGDLDREEKYKLDEQFAEEMAEIAYNDDVPSLAVDKEYKNKGSG